MGRCAFNMWERRQPGRIVRRPLVFFAREEISQATVIDASP